MHKILLMAAVLALGGCSTFSHKASLEGEVVYLQRIALPPSAHLNVKLQDVSLADAPAIALAEYDGPITGQVPIPWRLVYHPKDVKPGHRYSVSARIEAGGHLLFVTTAHHDVQLNGQDPQPLRIRVDPAQ
ncbi:YbaY family lipoprotein [Pseudomonas sp. dw_358]|uniref:YbaY family lipoprotein n=1 Tax=Pseudomonas sp. dw_358 TaxID=2720083 RepID=UPI001BD4526D|nr:YbaY family lipoprotein [Pseudomonas sp. dw_358]